MLTGENWIKLFDIILALGFFLEGKNPKWVGNEFFLSFIGEQNFWMKLEQHKGP